MIIKSIEVIIDVNAGVNFYKIMLFGTDEIHNSQKSNK